MEKQEILKTLEFVKNELKEAFKSINGYHNKIDIMPSNIEKEIISTQYQLICLDKEVDKMIESII